MWVTTIDVTTHFYWVLLLRNNLHTYVCIYILLIQYNNSIYFASSIFISSPCLFIFFHIKSVTAYEVTKTINEQWYKIKEGIIPADSLLLSRTIWSDKIFVEMYLQGIFLYNDYYCYWKKKHIILLLINALF